MATSKLQYVHGSTVIDMRVFVEIKGRIVWLQWLQLAERKLCVELMY